MFLFEARPLIKRLEERRVKIGIATSIKKDEWDRARIHPTSPTAALELTMAQQTALGIFDLFDFEPVLSGE